MDVSPEQAAALAPVLEGWSEQVACSREAYRRYVGSTECAARGCHRDAEVRDNFCQRCRDRLTAEAALLEGFACIAIEREADYLPLIHQRINRRRDPAAYIKTAGEDGGLFDLLGGEPA